MQQLLRFPVDNAWLSGLFWLLVLIALLYVARRPAHTLIRTLGTGLARALRRTHSALSRSHGRLALSYRRQLFTYVRERAELQTSRELNRLERTIAHDLSGFPYLHRSLSEQLRRFDEDYRRTVETPPAPPEWIRAVESVSGLNRPDDPSVVRVLDDMHATLERACHTTLQSYRTASHRRHKVLRRMVPLWRRMHRTLDDIHDGVGRVEQRAVALQRQIVRFRTLAERHRERARRTASLIFARWCGALVALAIIVVAAITLHGLIARPLAEVGGGLGAGPDGRAFSSWLAISMLGLITACGLLITEASGVTRLIPGLGLARAAVRVGLGVMAGALLALLAAVSAALAWTRDYLIAVDDATAALFSAAGGGFPEPAFMWIPALTQSVLAVGLALIVALAAVPFENVLRQGMLAVTAAVAGVLRATGGLARVLAVLILTLTRGLLAAYDVVVCIPLFAERALRGRREREDRQPAALRPVGVEDAS